MASGTCGVGGGERSGGRGLKSEAGRGKSSIKIETDKGAGKFYTEATERAEKTEERLPRMNDEIFELP